MQTVTKKSGVESPASKSATAKAPSIASVPVPDTLALYMTFKTGLTRAEVAVRHEAIGAVAGVGFVMAVTAVIGRLLGFVAVG